MTQTAQALRLTCLTCGQANRLAPDRLDSAPRCGTCGEPLMAGKVASLDLATHDKATRADGVGLVIDYWAPWCGPCRMMAPEFLKAAGQLQGQVRFAKIDTQDHPAVAQRLGIRGIPLLILWRNGREMGRLAGARPAAEIAEFARRGATAG